MDFNPVKLKIVLGIVLSFIVGFVVLWIKPDYCVSANVGTYLCSQSISETIFELFTTFLGVFLLVLNFIIIYIIWSFFQKK